MPTLLRLNASEVTVKAQLTAEIHLRTRSWEPWQVWFTDFYCFGFKQAEDDDYLLVVHVSASVDFKIF
jgi:hypothetical protein